MRNTSIRHFAVAFCLLVALTLAVAPAAVPAVVPADETTIAAPWAARGPRGGYYARLMRNLRRLFGMDTDDTLAPPVPVATP